jgi:two-component system phosphate regulon sensor histidine kinase PhoR
MKARFRTKVFVGSFAAAGVSLLVLAMLISWQVRERQRQVIEQRLIDEARLIADLLSKVTSIEGPGLDREADRLGDIVSGRVTFIASDGRVVGDSTQTPAELSGLENQAARPEVVAAREGGGIGSSQRYSATVGVDLAYVAVRASHPSVGYVRLALPLTESDAQLATIRTAALGALAVAIPLAGLVSWFVSASLGRRVSAIARTAERYSTGDLSRSTHHYDTDELGTVGRALDDSVRQLGGRIEEMSRDGARMEAILGGMIEGVLVVDPQGRLQLMNRAAQVMLRVEPSVVGRPYLEVIRHPDIAAQLAAALRGNESGRQELTLARDPGRTFVARAAPIAGPSGGAVLVLHDISDLRRADQIRRDFVANVSHELRTPLTAIRGYVEALLDEPADEENTRKFLEIIARHSARMERLVQDLLRLARLDARQEALEIAHCDVQQLFSAVAADLAPLANAKRQSITIEVPAEAREVDVDPAKLHDIVRNLVENAVNYSPDGAVVRLAVSRDDGTYTITVADSGPGIPTGDLTRVFERFYRVDRSRSRPGGTGLGLAIVKHLVELHGGEAVAANRPEGGAVFTVTFPGSTTTL